MPTFGHRSSAPRTMTRFVAFSTSSRSAATVTLSILVVSRGDAQMNERRYPSREAKAALLISATLSLAMLFAGASSAMADPTVTQLVFPLMSSTPPRLHGSSRFTVRCSRQRKATACHSTGARARDPGSFIANGRPRFAARQRSHLHVSHQLWTVSSHFVMFFTVSP